MKNKVKIIIVLSILSILNYGCRNKDINDFQETYVVGAGFSLPYYGSWQEINGDSLDGIIRELRLYDKEDNYYIVDNEGKTMNNDFPQKKDRTSDEYKELAEKIKYSAWRIVQKDMFFITTVEKEMKALFAGERQIKGVDLDKLISDNKEAYKNKDYQKINDYLIAQNIKVWKSYLND